MQVASIYGEKILVKVDLLLCALVQVASAFAAHLLLSNDLLLCALVQVASKMRNNSFRSACHFCSAHLCKLLLGVDEDGESVVSFCSAHLCKLLRQNCTVLCVRQ